MFESSRQWSIAALYFGMAASSQAAQFETLQSDGKTFISMTGIIQEGDDITFKAIAATLPVGSAVVLSSQGGAVAPALEIGRAIRLKSFSTAVGGDDLCASACALIWLSGSARYMSSNAHIGFHAAYRMVGGKISGESGVGNALVGAYLSQLGLQQATIVYVTSAAPEGMAWLTPQSSSQFGIDVAMLDNSPKKQELKPKEETYDPLKAVTAFYSALGAADGETAAALVVPEKRGKGPFNEANIHQFFGGLSERLNLRGVVLQTPNNVTATYEYARADGTRCHGKAIVKTTFVYGNTLISGIRAISGC